MKKLMYVFSRACIYSQMGNKCFLLTAQFHKPWGGAKIKVKRKTKTKTRQGWMNDGLHLDFRTFSRVD